MKRRLLILLFVALFSVVLVACEEDANGTTVADDETDTTVQNGEQVDDDENAQDDDEADVEDENDEVNPLLQDIDNYAIEINGNRYYPLMTLYDLIEYGDFYLASVGSRRGEDGEVYVDDLFDSLHQPRVMTRVGLGEDGFAFPIITNYMDAYENSDKTNGDLVLRGLRFRYIPDSADTVTLPFGFEFGMDLDSVLDILGEPYYINELDGGNKHVTYHTAIGEWTMTLELVINASGVIVGLSHLDFIFLVS